MEITGPMHHLWLAGVPPPGQGSPDPPTSGGAGGSLIACSSGEGGGSDFYNHQFSRSKYSHQGQFQATKGISQLTGVAQARSSTALLPAHSSLEDHYAAQPCVLFHFHERVSVCVGLRASSLPPDCSLRALASFISFKVPNT